MQKPAGGLKAQQSVTKTRRSMLQGGPQTGPLQPQPQVQQQQQPPKLAKCTVKKMTRRKKEKKRTTATAACLSGPFSCSASPLWASLPDQRTRLSCLGQSKRVSVNEHCRSARRAHFARVSVLSASSAVPAVRLSPRCHGLRLSWASL